jgi:PIN domain nuclease of toxin-antitoxin system
MTEVNVHQAKTQLSQLLRSVEAGEEVVIAQALVERLPVLTADPVFERYNVEVIAAA